MPQIPNLFIIGAPKTGSTALAEILNLHPEIYLDPRKEPRYFDQHIIFEDPKDYPIKDIKDYLKVYKKKKSIESKYSVDASVCNMYSELSIKNILNFNPTSKFILILRDPIDAAKSMHLQQLKYLEEAHREIYEDFDEVWPLLRLREKGYEYPKGCKTKFLFRYDLLYSYQLYLPFIRKNIKKEHILIINYESFKINYKKVISSILNFLNVSKIDLPNLKKNPSGISEFSKKNILIFNTRKFLQKVSKKLNLSNTYLTNKIASSKLLSYELTKKNIKVLKLESEIKDYFKPSYKAIEEIKDIMI